MQASRDSFLMKQESSGKGRSEEEKECESSYIECNERSNIECSFVGGVSQLVLRHTLMHETQPGCLVAAHLAARED